MSHGLQSSFRHELDRTIQVSSAVPYGLDRTIQLSSWRGSATHHDCRGGVGDGALGSPRCACETTVLGESPASPKGRLAGLQFNTRIPSPRTCPVASTPVAHKSRELR